MRAQDIYERELPEDVRLMEAVCMFLAEAELGDEERALSFVATDFLIIEDCPAGLARGRRHARYWVRRVADLGFQADFDRIDWVGGQVRSGDEVALMRIAFSRDGFDSPASVPHRASALVQMTREADQWRVGGIEWRLRPYEMEQGRLH